MKALGTAAAVVVVFAIGLAVVAGFSVLLAFPVMWCWNYAVTDVFGAPAISWGQAWCLMFLSGMLLKASATATTRKE